MSEEPAEPMSLDRRLEIISIQLGELVKHSARHAMAAERQADVMEAIARKLPAGPPGNFGGFS